LESASSSRAIFSASRGAGPTDGELAAELGLKSQGEVTGFKKRAAAPSANHVLVIARRSGVDPGWLAFGHECAAPEPEGFVEWVTNSRLHQRGPAAVPDVPSEPEEPDEFSSAVGEEAFSRMPQREFIPQDHAGEVIPLPIKKPRRKKD
jgi:hypothetical protein